MVMGTHRVGMSQYLLDHLDGCMTTNGPSAQCVNGSFIHQSNSCIIQLLEVSVLRMVQCTRGVHTAPGVLTRACVNQKIQGTPKASKGWETINFWSYWFFLSYRKAQKFELFEDSLWYQWLGLILPNGQKRPQRTILSVSPSGIISDNLQQRLGHTN